MMDSSLKPKAIKGTLWSAIDRLSVQIINFGLSLAIARLLDPSDYGIIAMTMLFITLSNVFVDSGFANALVRKNDRTETDNSTVFYFNIAVGTAVYAIMWVASPLIAKFYNLLFSPSSFIIFNRPYQHIHCYNTANSAPYYRAYIRSPKSDPVVPSRYRKKRHL